LMCGRGEYL